MSCQFAVVARNVNRRRQIDRQPSDEAVVRAEAIARILPAIDITQRPSEYRISVITRLLECVRDAEKLHLIGAVTAEECNRALTETRR